LHGIQVLRARLDRKGKHTERARKAAAAQRAADKTAQADLEVRLLRTQARWAKDADSELREAEQRRAGGASTTLGWLQSKVGSLAGAMLPTDKDFDISLNE
jgi:hypothetical protein